MKVRYPGRTHCLAPISSFSFHRLRKAQRAERLSLYLLFSRHGFDQLALPGSRAREVVVGFPCGALACGHLFCETKIRQLAVTSRFEGTGCELTHHLIDLFESQASCLRHKEVGPEDTAAAKSAPDEEHLRSEVAVCWVNHVWNDDTCGGC
jgi:hypothetical protein